MLLVKPVAEDLTEVTGKVNRLLCRHKSKIAFLDWKRNIRSSCNPSKPDRRLSTAYPFSGGHFHYRASVKLEYKSNQSNKSKKEQVRKVDMVYHIVKHSSKRKFVQTFINSIRTKLQLDSKPYQGDFKEYLKILGTTYDQDSDDRSNHPMLRPLHLIAECQHQRKVSTRKMFRYTSIKSQSTDQLER